MLAKRLIGANGPLQNDAGICHCSFNHVAIIALFLRSPDETDAVRIEGAATARS
jgi:hypothetical protein